MTHNTHPGVTITFNSTRNAVYASINGEMLGKGNTRGEALKSAVAAYRGDTAGNRPISLTEFPYALILKNIQRHEAVAFYLLGRTVYEAHKNHAEMMRAFSTRKEAVAYIRGRMDERRGFLSRNGMKILAWTKCGTGWKLEVIK